MKRVFLKNLDMNGLLKMREQGMSNSEIAKVIGCHYDTIHKALGKQPYNKKEREERMNGETEKVEVDLASSNFGAMLICALRYACGRKTEMPMRTASFALSLLPYVSDETIERLKKDIESRCDRDYAQICSPIWLQLLSEAKNEEKRREVKKCQSMLDADITE